MIRFILLESSLRFARCPMPQGLFLLRPVEDPQTIALGIASLEDTIPLIQGFCTLDRQ
jgi:hypothetical protein